MELVNKKIAILAEDNYEDLELWYPLLRLKEAGAEVSVVGMSGVQAYHSKHDVPVTVDAAANAELGDDVDAVIIPGGYAPDRMRRHAPMLDLVRRVFQRGGLVAMICHAGRITSHGSHHSRTPLQSDPSLVQRARRRAGR